MVHCTIRRPCRTPTVHQENSMTSILTVTPSPALFGDTAPPLFDTWSRVAGLYRDATQASTQQMMLSSARIIQEHTLRAFISAAQACADALAKNAMAVQQQALERYIDANGKAAGMMSTAFAQAWIRSLQPAK